MSPSVVSRASWDAHILSFELNMNQQNITLLHDRSSAPVANAGNLKVAIIHYWLVGMRGGEKVIEALCDMYPQADIFTHVYVPEMVSDRIRQHRIIPTFINALPRAAQMYKTYLPLMPLALEQLDLRGYDLIISSESGPAKGIIAPPETVQSCHC